MKGDLFSFTIGSMVGMLIMVFVQAGVDRALPTVPAQQPRLQPVVVEDPTTGFSCIQYPPEGPTRGRIVIRF